MPKPIIDDLLDMFPDTVDVEEPSAYDTYGRPTGYGTKKTIAARVTGRIMVVKGMDGQEKVSTVQVVIAGVVGVTPQARVTLPARYVPNQPKVIAVSKATDENGPHHERIYF
jgi:hypothetical protein